MRWNEYKELSLGELIGNCAKGLREKIGEALSYYRGTAWFLGTCSYRVETKFSFLHFHENHFRIFVKICLQNMGKLNEN